MRKKDGGRGTSTEMDIPLISKSSDGSYNGDIWSLGRS